MKKVEKVERVITQLIERVILEERWGVLNLLAVIETALADASKKYDFAKYDDRVDFVKNEIFSRIDKAESIELPNGTTFERSFEPSKRT